MRTMYTRFCSAVLFPLHEAFKGHQSVALRRELERTQWLDRPALEALRLERLRTFLAQAGRLVPYYRELFGRVGFHPERLSSIDELTTLPVLTKDLIRTNTQRLMSESAGRVVRFNTGGSSGEPLIFYMGMDRISHDVASKWRATRWWGVDIGDPEIVLWGSPIELGAQDQVKSLRDRVLRSRLLPAFDMSEQGMNEYVEVIRRARPRMMFGYASALARLAAHACSKGITLRDCGVRVVFTTGETLYPHQRQILEEAFGAPVANGYGSRDGGFIAHQCPSGSLHLSFEHVVVELTDAAGQAVAAGVPGEVVITHLATRDFPFVRYRTGDMATLSERPCQCGRGLPVLETVQGRTTDFIRTRSGTVMHALAMIYEVRDKAGVRSFKFIQSEDLGIDLQIVAAPEFTGDIERTVLAGLARRLGPDTPVKITRVERIEPERSGKHRYVVSRASALSSSI
ncbi:MAG: phenylacetate--CoA ligase family protein [Steroidobacteraceae bacterium]